MKSLSDAGFFRAFEALADAGNPGLKRKSWEFCGARWRRDRYSISGPEYTVIIEAFTVRHASRPHWRLLVAKEHWWGDEQDTIRSARWSRPTEGRRADILAWFRKQEREIIEPGE